MSALGGDDVRAARPLVTVIIPAYNLERYVGEAIDSALAQTYPAIEVIVVDDGSTDGTPAVIDSYGDRIRAVHQENGGPMTARNAGLARASGELVAFLDGDDLWFPERIERLAGFLEAHPELGMVTSDSYVMEETTPTTKRSYPHRRKRPFPATVEDQIPEIARFNFLFIGVLFRRSLVDRCGPLAVTPRKGRPGSIEGSEDFELWTRFLLSGARAGFVDEPLGYYRVRPGSLSQSPNQMRSHQTVLEMHLPELWKLGARGKSVDCYDIGTRLVAHGRRREAVPFFWHAVTGEGASAPARVRYAASGLRRLVWPSAAHLERHRTGPAEPASASRPAA